MSQPLHPPRAQWSSFTSYVLVTTGAVVGLGNLINFPYYVYQYGGCFILLFIACEILISVPILFAELLIGRKGKQNPVGSISLLAFQSGANQRWQWLGWLCFIISFLSLADYAVLVAFPEGYFSTLFMHVMTHALPTETLSSTHTSTIRPVVQIESCFLIFLAATMAVIARGINRGLESISRITVPFYFITLLGLAIYTCSVGHFSAALSHLTRLLPDESFSTVLFAALSYAFFKLNVGMGTMIVYGSYLPYSVSIGKSTVVILLLDAMISLLAYFVIYPLTVLSHPLALQPASYHDTLLFFSQIPYGHIVALLFFLVTVIAAWTPTIAIAESATVILIERFHLPRIAAAILVFVGAALLGTAFVLSFYSWSDKLFFNRWTIYTFIDGLVNNVLIPISAFLIALFAGWMISRSITASELQFKPFIYTTWRFLMRLIIPLLIVGISVNLLL